MEPSSDKPKPSPEADESSPLNQIQNQPGNGNPGPNTEAGDYIPLDKIPQPDLTQ